MIYTEIMSLWYKHIIIYNIYHVYINIIQRCNKNITSHTVLYSYYVVLDYNMVILYNNKML